MQTVVDIATEIDSHAATSDAAGRDQQPPQDALQQRADAALNELKAAAAAFKPPLEEQEDVELPEDVMDDLAAALHKAARPGAARLLARAALVLVGAESPLGYLVQVRGGGKESACTS
jgi:hypothetical protein